MRERLDEHREWLPVAAHHLRLSTAEAWSDVSLDAVLRALVDEEKLERWRGKVRAEELLRVANDYLLQIGVLKPKR